MKQDYFTHDGIKYNTGTIVVILRFNYITGRLHKENAKFIYFDTDTNEYILEIERQNVTYTPERFNKLFVEVYNPNKQKTANVQSQPKQHTFSDELHMDSLLIAWFWYVFIMAVGVIFYDRIGIWILASVIFFNYRNKKLKEAGYK